MDTPVLLPLQRVQAGSLEIAFHDSGPVQGQAAGPPVLLMHGFPYDIHAYAEVLPRLVAQGCRVLVPYLRGFGPTRFLRADTPRSGEQAALGADLLALMDALALPQAVLAGYDWGGRAACVVAALWPERCAGLLSFNSYNIQHIDRAMLPDTPENEQRLWYQYYFHSERGRAGLARDRRALCRLLWRTWSPTWSFDDATYARSAAAFDNPDFVDVVIHSYRHRFGLVAGDPALADIEARLAAAARHPRAQPHLRRRRRRCAPARQRGPAWPAFQRPAAAQRGAGRGPQHAAGSAGAVCRRGAALGARRTG